MCITCTCRWDTQKSHIPHVHVMTTTQHCVSVEKLDGHSTTHGRNICLRWAYDQSLYQSESLFEITTIIVLTPNNQICELLWCTCITTLKLIRMYVLKNIFHRHNDLHDYLPNTSWPQNTMLSYILLNRLYIFAKFKVDMLHFSKPVGYGILLIPIDFVQGPPISHSHWVR